MMTARELRAALRALGWSQSRAAEELAIGGGQQRVSEWCTGRREVPGYIAAHVETWLTMRNALDVLAMYHTRESCEMPDNCGHCLAMARAGR